MIWESRLFIQNLARLVECDLPSKATPKPPSSQEQAISNRGTLDCSSIVPRLVLDWCSIGARLVLDWCSIGARLVLDWCSIGARLFLFLFPYSSVTSSATPRRLHRTAASV